MTRTLLPLAALLLSACDGKGGAFTVFNTPPSATISTPVSGSTFDQYETVTFSGRVGDDIDAASSLEVKWLSTIDGELIGALPADGDGYVQYSTANLSPGNHVIALYVSDKEGESSRFEITIGINELPAAPSVSVVHPVSGEYGREGEPYEFQVLVSDSKDDPIELTVEFISDSDGTFCTIVPDTVGLASCRQELSVGDHFLTFRARDSDGDSGTASAYFTVKDRDSFDADGDGWTGDQGDCDDDNPNVYPGATETSNGLDDDCDGIVDNNTATYDDDGDGYSEAEGDCDDADATTYPGATELYDSLDNDCDSIIDEGTIGYDDDGDGYSEVGGDCDDTRASVYPGATELEDGLDNDCDGITDEGTPAYDNDGDGYSERGGDCDDTDSAIHPGATEVCGDGEDNDCDGSADEAGSSGCTTYYRDYDSDAFGTSSSSSCLCSASGYYTSTYSTDCYDYNGNAYPGASSWWTTQRGDSSYDYDCDGSQTKQYSSTASCGTSLGDCYVASSGWSSSVPACGSSGGYSLTSDSDGCSWSWSSFSCVVTSTTTYTQSCR